MDAKVKVKSTEKKRVKANAQKPETNNCDSWDVSNQRPKSKTTLFWEKYPDGIGSKIIDMRAVLK